MSVLAFLLGVYLSIRVIAALYGIIDFWYAIGEAYPRVLRAIAVWGLLAAALAWALPGQAFGLGFATFLVFYLSLYVVRYPLFWLLRRRQQE
jgi:hypothetical protein